MKAMKRIFTLSLMMSFLLIQPASAQLLKKITGGSKSADSSTASTTKKSIKDMISGAKSGGLTTDEIAAGLKEALSVGAEQSGKKLSALDGYFGNAAIKVLMPEEAKKVEQKLRSLGMGKQVDQAILSMNRAAEDAAKSAAPIFINAIKQMTIQDAMGILKGGDLAATNYLKNKTTASLTESFRPVIEQSLKKVDATKYWNTVFTTYNKFSKEKVNTDLSAYVTEKALSGIFYQVGEEEKKIRKDPMARTSEILKKVFANQ
jgi:Protein of unknown function (DUF4197)